MCDYLKRIKFTIFIAACLGMLVNCSQKNQKKTLFQLLDSEETHVDFNNALTSTDSLNILDFEYMYNGAGVAIGDINNDGLSDMYFSGNQVSGKLYLNKGNLTFEDITDKAGVATTGWSNGVSMSDVNNDGFVDIYVCRGGPRETKEEDKGNLLFLNQGDGTFKELAQEMGVADTGYSIQALFFDYDKDGHKDLYVLTNALVDYNRNNTKPIEVKGEAASTDRLYRNNGDGTFTDVSQQAGVTIEGFGLGITVCDINEDLWPDLYISNDFLTNDILYVNNQDGTFTDKVKEYIKHQSYNGMGNDVADIDNDGKSDIMVLDMFPQDNKRIKQTMMKPSYDTYTRNLMKGYSPQFVRNTLQLNNGNGTFSEVGQLTGLHNTDWSWAPLIADFDNDGWKDVFITNGYRRDITNLDYVVYSEQNSVFGEKKVNEKDQLDKLTSLPEVKLHNYIYKNNGDLTFTDMVDEWGFDLPTYSNGAAYADLDNDGDLEIVVNNIDDKASIYKNNTIEQQDSIQNNSHFLRVKLTGTLDPTGTKVSLYNDGSSQHQSFSPVRGYLSNVEQAFHFGLGKSTEIDSLKVVWPNGFEQTIHGLQANKTVVLNQKDSEPASTENKGMKTLFTKTNEALQINYQHAEDIFIEFKWQPSLMRMYNQLGPGLAVGDVNGDNLEDFYVGGSKEKKGGLFLQQADGTFAPKEFGGEEPREDMGLVFADIDSDGDLDLLSVHGGGVWEMTRKDYKDLIYINDGKGNFSSKTLLERESRGSVIRLADMDRDGDLDIFIGGRVIHGAYPTSPKSYLLQNNGGSFEDATEAVFGSDGRLGMISDALWTDFDDDGWVDMIMVGEFMEIQFLKNEKGRLVNITSQTGLTNHNGLWNSIVSGDFDADGDTDYIMGNLGLNNDFKVSPEEPLTLYAKDFDENGNIDPLVSCFRNGSEHLIHPRDVLIDQINGMRNRFLDYESYANADMSSTLSKKDLDGAQVYTATNLASTYVENLGNGKFKSKSLPLQAQFSPIYGMQVHDYNADGRLDVLVAGNHFSVEPFMGRYDAFVGLCLLGDGQGNFKTVPTNESGLDISGDAKGMATIQSASGEKSILVGQNSGTLQSYSYGAKMEQLMANPMDAYAIVHLKNGSSFKTEFYYGGSYLSHSSRSLGYETVTTDYIEIVDYLGKKRKIEVQP
ncbi:VCBS repeat-containing protein [Allomuricauda sp. CP2A]|uniref:VCBS repeat-containing protein n=1 Tax=Allomuricauda sp. CP2A TaxID=1848189 RepID=UPI0008360A13|nr:VCBS repeat-containing protein [Muricauda sp. CP2A]